MQDASDENASSLGAHNCDLESEISTDSLTPAGQKEWFRKHASQIMARSGNADDLDPANDDFGGFKRVQVRSYLFVSIRLAV